MMIKKRKEKKKKKKTKDKDKDHDNSVKEYSLSSISKNDRNSLKFIKKLNSFVIFESTHISFFSKFTFLAKKRQL